MFPKRWIQGAAPKQGALHRELHYPISKPLPVGLLNAIEDAHVGTHVRGRKVTRLLKSRVNFALNVRR